MIKQIEEMAKFFVKQYCKQEGCDCCNLVDEYGSLFESCEDYLSYYRMAEKFYNAGYRKIPEGSVVLTREEYERLLTRPLNAMGDLVIGKIKNKKKCGYDKDDICVNSDSEHLADYCPLKEELVQARKETAREIFNAIFATCNTELIACEIDLEDDDGKYWEYWEGKLSGIRNTIADITNVAKQYGVEVEE